MREFLLGAAMSLVFALPAFGSAIDDLNTVLKDPNAPGPQPPAVGNVSPCNNSPGGISLLGVQMQGGATGGTRTLNPNYPGNTATLERVTALEKQRANVARTLAPNLYEIGKDTASGAWVDLGVIPEFLKLAIEAEPDEMLVDVSHSAAELRKAEREKKSPDEIAYYRQAYEAADKEYKAALARLHRLQEETARYEAALAPLNTELMTMHRAADQLCKGG